MSSPIWTDTTRISSPIPLGSTANNSPSTAFDIAAHRGKYETITIPAPLEETTLTYISQIGHNITTLVIQVGRETDHNPQAEEKAKRKSSFLRRLSGNNTSRKSSEGSSQFWSDVRGKLRTRSEVTEITEVSLVKSASNGERASASSTEQTGAERQWMDAAVGQWRYVLATYFQNVNTLVIKVDTEHDWAVKTEVESILLVLRIAIELAQMPKLRRFRFQSVHAMGIMQFRWYGFSAFHRSPPEAYIVWRKITRLDLQVRSPFNNMNPEQKATFTGALHDYLASFSTTVKALRFIWIGGKGPSPMLLHREPGLETRPATRWPALIELWLGNMIHLDYAVRSASVTCPLLDAVQTLKSEYSNSKKSFEERKAWVEILLGEARCTPRRNGGYPERTRTLSTFEPLPHSSTQSTLRAIFPETEQQSAQVAQPVPDGNDDNDEEETRSVLYQPSTISSDTTEFPFFLTLDGAGW